MFTKIRTTKYLKLQVDIDQLSVGFVGKVARVARVHQEGLKDKVTKRGPEYSYPLRPLFGLDAGDRKMIREFLLHHIQTI